MTSFDRVKSLTTVLGHSPIAPPAPLFPQSTADVSSVLQSVQENTRSLGSFISRARAYAGRWFLEQDAYHRDAYDFNLISAISLLAEKGVPAFLSSFDLDDEEKEMVREFLTDIVRVEWQFAQLVAEKPENTKSYQEQLRTAYSQIVDRMKSELPHLPWVSRSRVGARLAA